MLRLLIAFVTAAAAQETASGFNIWNGAIAAFERQDAAESPPAHPVLFVGSSTIVFWKIKEHFPGLDAINRGFGGSTVADALHFFDRVVTRYEPRLIVFYSGDNDMALGKSTAQVSADYAAFIARVREKLPRARLILIGIKPSIARWKLYPAMQEVNASLKAAAAADAEHVAFVDAAPAVLGADGQPDPAMLQKDGLHLSDAGYEKLTALVRPIIAAFEKDRP